jgi:hypothetical protein
MSQCVPGSCVSNIIAGQFIRLNLMDTSCIPAVSCATRNSTLAGWAVATDSLNWESPGITFMPRQLGSNETVMPTHLSSTLFIPAEHVESFCIPAVNC